MWEHNFLIEDGNWSLKGNWLERNSNPVSVTGITRINWREANWFTMQTLVEFPSVEDKEILYNYRGRFDAEKSQYTYLLKQNMLGRLEGEGWLTASSILQRYWVLDDKQRRSGFEHYYRLAPTTYYLCSTIFTGNYLTSTMEVILERQS